MKQKNMCVRTERGAVSHIPGHPSPQIVVHPCRRPNVPCEQKPLLSTMTIFVSPSFFTTLFLWPISDNLVVVKFLSINSLWGCSVTFKYLQQERSVSLLSAAKNRTVCLCTDHIVQHFKITQMSYTSLTKILYSNNNKMYSNFSLSPHRFKMWEEFNRSKSLLKKNKSYFWIFLLKISWS